MSQARYKLKNIAVFGFSHDVYVAITDRMTPEELQSCWRDIRNEIMTEFQDKLTDDFSRWNFYVFYVVDDLNTLNGSLRYMIEHDTVSSRKILIDGRDTKDDENSYEAVVKKYISYDILPAHKVDNEIKPFEKSEDVMDLIKFVRDEN